MKKLCASLFIIAVVASNSRASSSGSQGAAVAKKTDSSDPQVVKSQLLIRFKDEVPEAEVKKILDKHALKFLQKLGSMNLYLAEVPETSSTQDMQAVLKAEPAVKYSEPNSVMRTFKK